MKLASTFIRRFVPAFPFTAARRLSQNHKMTGVARTSASICPILCSSKNTQSRVTGPHPGDFWRSPRRRPHSIWAACATAPSPTQQRNVSWCSERTSCVVVCAHCLLSWRWAPLTKSLPLSSLPHLCIAAVLQTRMLTSLMARHF